MKSTNEDFYRFVAHCKWWLKELSLGSYCFAFRMMEEDHDASCMVSDEMMCLVTLSTEREGYLSVPHLARHEMLEAFVDDSFRNLYGFLDPEYIQEKRHRLIHRLEKILPIPSDLEVGYAMGKKKGKKTKPVEKPKKKGK